MDELAVYYFHQGTTSKAYEILGAHIKGNMTTFTVWAPNARFVSVVGDFNNWNIYTNPMYKVTNEGLYEVTIKGVKEFDRYQFAISTKDDNLLFKSDPYAFHSDLRPGKCSKVYNLDGFNFTDDEWMQKRRSINKYEQPLNIYELNIGSWRKYKDGNFFNYADIAQELCDYVKDMGYTHIELMPLSEFPYDPSWGYQVTGYYSVTSRYGTPKDFMKFVDICHNNNIGVIMDWVPGHFTKDAHGLIEFDGDYLYEPSDEQKREIKGWGTRCFDYGRCEIQSFLVSNAVFWCEKFHIDGLRTDAVSSMLYLDYGRNPGEWHPNNLGTKINLEGQAFLIKVNSMIKKFDPSILMFAEESTAYPRITDTVEKGGLGFDYKWNMGWMNDSLKYIELDPFFRGEHYNLITFQMTYIFSEHHVLALSHDEVVHLKKSLINKMPGRYDQKFSSLKSYMTYFMTHPGKKLSFMGNEIGQFNEWNELNELDWSVLKYSTHQNLKKYNHALNKLYLNLPELHNDTTYWEGFKWLVVDDKAHTVFAYERMCGMEKVIVILNFSFCEWPIFTFEVESGEYEVILCSEDVQFGGSKNMMGQTYISDGKLKIALPYSSGIILKRRK